MLARLGHFHIWCIGWSTALAVQLRCGDEPALQAAEKLDYARFEGAHLQGLS
jgi:hypothetical protein